MMAVTSACGFDIPLVACAMSRLSDALCCLRYWTFANLNPPTNPTIKPTMTSDALLLRNAYLLIDLPCKRYFPSPFFSVPSINGGQKNKSLVVEPTCKPNSVPARGLKAGSEWRPFIWGAHYCAAL